MTNRRQYSDDVRGEIVGLHKAGKTQRQISTTTGVPHQSVNSVIQHWKKTNTVTCAKRAGRPPKFTDDVKNFVDKLIQKKDKTTSEEIKQKLVEHYGRTYEHSDRHIRRIRQELGYHKTQGVGLEVLLDRHREERVKYCKKHKTDQFSNVIWSDEKPWQLYKNRRMMWVKCGQRVKTKMQTKYPPRIQCWGAVSPWGKCPLVWLEERSSIERYKKVLKHTLLPWVRRAAPLRHRFQHDKDVSHTTKAIRAWCDKHLKATFHTPTRSPDLNPIEMLWNILEMRVYKHKIKTVQQLKSRIQKEWDCLSINDIDTAILKVRERIPKIVECEGNYIDVRRRLRRR